ncbi:MAG: hypothetical protein MJ252_30815 [archaeon]|nr:hypothetical protein [archaeon]
MNNQNKSGLLHTTDVTKEKQVKEIEFSENPKLSVLYQWNFDDFQQDIFKKNREKDQANNATDYCACDMRVIDSLSQENNPDPDYVYKKEFLNLGFNQTEDQSTLEYKKKMLAKKVMKDKTFSVNKVFEFTFDDKVKNFIASTFSKDPKLERIPKEDIFLKEEKDFDNDFIINLCQGRFGLEDIYGPRKKKVDLNSDNLKDLSTFENLGEEEEEFAVMAPEYEICEVMEDGEFSFNYEEDEKFDWATYGFFKNYIKTHDNTTIAAKIELMLNKIMAKSDKTGKDIFTNKMKNERLRYWKAEYDARAREINQNYFNQKLNAIKGTNKFKSPLTNSLVNGRKALAKSLLPTIKNKMKKPVSSPTNQSTKYSRTKTQTSRKN